ncbi:MAG: hypothetical protein DVB28_001621 [Verrucomicrobia bacterium]|nr:MAG: hypothetical protein DVB28_001621 [Verrucomicrobiota bacterium]
MKQNLLTTLGILALGASALAHGGVELGPHGGRILEFSKNESMHGEVIMKSKEFHIALLDKDMKAVVLTDQELTATSGDRAKPEKLAVEKKDGVFVVPVVKAGEWVIFQFRENAKAKPVTARLQYDLTVCGGCKEPEWLCKCAAEKGKGAK